MRADERPPRPDRLSVLRILGEGALEVRGRMPWSSNGTFLAESCLDGETLPVVYKPLRGERPLWDYPSGLYRREAAAWVVSEALGWGLVPETVVREEGPFGPGSAQRFVEADFAEQYFTLLERPENHATLAAICVFDLLINSGDRKAGHCLWADGRIWAIDNGLCLHAEPKLRSVIWEFAGQPVPEHLLADVSRLAQAPPAALGGLISDDEVVAMADRAARMIRFPVFPPMRSDRSFPWPLL